LPETFLLFAQSFPSSNLGFVDSKKDTLDVEVAGHEYSIHQSPSLLNSARQTGTTGAVLWKITPLLATWLESSPPMLANWLHKDAVIVELGCGAAGLLGLVLAKLVYRYILTDQAYVMKYLRENIDANGDLLIHAQRSSRQKTGRQPGQDLKDKLKVATLDWEEDEVAVLRPILGGRNVEMVIMCDCVYNEHLVGPLVETCVDICKMGSEERRTMVLVAQQLRSDSVFQLFLETLMQDFQIFRVSDDKISADLKSGSGYVVHLAVLKT
jgi:hypothetical protein